jgi:glycosyltransferase involved in cell wall biosynthesis
MSQLAKSLAPNSRIREKLVIVSTVVHYKLDGKLYAYAPYAREIEIWADLFDEVLIAAPCREQTPPGDCALLDRLNLGIAPQRELGGETLLTKAKLLFTVPLLSYELAAAIRQGDALQVRCPGNLGLLGSLLGPLFSKHRVAKYAGQWSSGPNEAWTNRLQRAILRSRWWGSPVTVYGRWPNQPDHIIPFFNSAMTDAQVARARAAAARRSPQQLRNILFVGRLSRAKNVHVLLNALGRLRREGIAFTATIAGEGPEGPALQKLSADLNLSGSVEFTGGVGFDRVVELLERSGVLVLASETEGWPKALVEGMAFGLVAIGSNIGLVPEILSEGRGFTVAPGDVDALTDTLRKALSAPENYSEMRTRAAEWASHYSIESLRDSLHSMLAKRWNLQLSNEIKKESASTQAASAVYTHE